MRGCTITIALLSLLGFFCANCHADEDKQNANAEKVRAAEDAAKRKQADVEAVLKQLRAIERKNAIRQRQRLKLNEEVLQRANAANIRNLQKQFRPQFENLLKIELAFVQRVCELTEQQQKALAEGSNRCLKDALTAYATAHANPANPRGQRLVLRGGNRVVVNGGVRVLGNGVINGISIDGKRPQEQIEESVADLVKQTLRRDQTEKYSNELIRRSENRVRIAAEFLVAKLDEQLILDSQQREKLTEVLVTNWQESWQQSVEMAFLNQQISPASLHIIPIRLLRPHLNKTQLSAWYALLKGRNLGQAGVIQWGGGLGLGPGFAPGFAPDAVVDDFEVEFQVENIEGDDVQEEDVILLDIEDFEIDVEEAREKE